MLKNCSILLALVLLLVFQLSEQQPTTPGLSTYIQESAMNYMCRQAIPLIVNKVTSTKLDNVEQDLHTPIGRVHFTLSNIHINQFSIADLGIKIVQNTGFQAEVKDIHLALHADWKYREKSFPHISDHGNVDVTIDVDVALLIHISLDANGHLVVNIDPNVHLGLRNLKVKLHGGASWLYNLFINAFKGSIEHSVYNALRNMIVNDLNNRLQKVVSTINYQTRVGNPGYKMFIDFSLVNTDFSTSAPGPVFGMGAKGIFYIDKPDYIVYPGPAAPYVPYQPLRGSPSMIQIIITDYLINTAGWSSYQDGIIHKLVTNDDIPPEIPFKLSTDMLKTIAPGLYQKYPSTPMQLLVTDQGKDFEKAPKAVINTNGTTISTVGELEWSVIVDKQVIQVFVLNFTTTAELMLSVKDGTKVVGNMKLDKLLIGLVSSQVGPIDIAGLNMLVSSFFNYIFIPLVNKQFEDGFTLPTFEGLVLKDPQIVFKDRFIGIVSDFTYTPTY